MALEEQRNNAVENYWLIFGLLEWVAAMVVNAVAAVGGVVTLVVKEMELEMIMGC